LTILGATRIEFPGTAREPVDRTWRIAWQDDPAGRPKAIGRVESARLQLAARDRSRIWFDSPRDGFSIDVGPDELAKVSLCITRTESRDTATASFDVGVNESGIILRKA
jgi:hypothetical protein